MSKQVKPRLNMSFKVKVVDSQGKTKKGHLKETNLTRYCVKGDSSGKGKKIISTKTTTYCRETLVGDIAAFAMASKSLPEGRKLRLTNDPAVLSFKMEGVQEPIGVHDAMYVSTYRASCYQSSYELANSRRRQKELFLLLDVVLGTSALLLCGPKGYTREGYNKAAKITGTNTLWGGDNGKVEKVKYCLRYNGVSSQVVKHPSLVSYISGMGRFCIQLYLEGLYEEINKKLGLSKIKRRLRVLANKKQLNKANKKWLLKVLASFEPWWSLKRIGENLGGYPLNRYTWGMFKLFVEEMEKLDGDFLKIWRYKVASNGGIYGYRPYGFLDWCKDHPHQSSDFSRRSTSGWTGTTRNDAYF